MNHMTARRGFAAVAATSALFTLAACGSDDTDAADSPATTPAATDATTDAGTDAATGAFTAGEYESKGSYKDPNGQTQTVDVELTLTADGTITELDVEGEAEGGNSEQYQGKFESGINAEVVGKKITDLKVDKVSGSSLTSGGFNEAIATIISQAQA